MADDPNKPDEPETNSLLRQIDQICGRFEAEWNSGRQPQIEDYSLEAVVTVHGGCPDFRGLRRENGTVPGL